MRLVSANKMYPIRDYLDRPLSSLPELRALGEQCNAAAATHVGASALGAASPLEPTADALEGLSEVEYADGAAGDYIPTTHFGSGDVLLKQTVETFARIQQSEKLRREL